MFAFFCSKQKYLYDPVTAIRGRRGGAGLNSIPWTATPLVRRQRVHQPQHRGAGCRRLRRRCCRPTGNRGLGGNYDQTRQEPTVLPARNTLCNGQEGMASRMATKCRRTTCARWTGTTCCNTPESLEFIKKPDDFPTAGLILGTEGQPLRDGARVRDHAGPHQHRANTSDRMLITELPYQVMDHLIEQISQAGDTEEDRHQPQQKLPAPDADRRHAPSAAASRRCSTSCSSTRRCARPSGVNMLALQQHRCDLPQLLQRCLAQQNGVIKTHTLFDCEQGQGAGAHPGRLADRAGLPGRDHRPDPAHARARHRPLRR